MPQLGLVSFESLRTPVGELCPWLCREEWELVYSWLFSPSQQLARTGIGRVAAWRARVEDFPLGVDLTSDLLECQLNKGEGCRDLVLLHCMALSRFVNAVCDTARTQSTTLLSRGIASCAGMLGVPSWIVSLRHEGTHSHLPNLTEFQAAVDFALHWMKNNYWLPQMDTLGQKLKECNERQLDSMQIEASAESLVAHSQSATWRLTKGLCSNKSDLSQHLAQAEHDDLVQLLKKRQLLNFSPAVTYSVSLPAEAELALFPTLEISEGELQQWRKRLLRIVQISSSFKQKLVIALIATIHDHCSAEQRDYLASWLGPLLKDSYEIETEEESGLEIISIDDTEQLLPGELNWMEVASAASAHPGYYSHAIMAIVVKRLKTLKQAVKEKMLYLSTLVTLSERIGSASYIKGTRLGKLEVQAEKAMAAITAKCAPATSSMESPFTKRSKLASSFANLPATKKARLEPNDSRDINKDGDSVCKKWAPVGNIYEWLQTPLGLCPGQSLSPSMFDLPTKVDSLSFAALSKPATPKAPSPEVELSSDQQRFTSVELEHLKQCIDLL